MNPAIAQAVAQHHVRRNKKGFPALGSAMKMNRIAEIVGVADEFVRLIGKAESDPSIDPIRVMESEHLPNFSRQMIVAFQAAFSYKRLK